MLGNDMGVRVGSNIPSSEIRDYNWLILQTIRETSGRFHPT